jgi:predicted NBD/HSP70 family sugar kinase
MKIIDAHIQKKILVNIGGGEAASVGRRPNLLIRNPKAYHAIGVDFQNGKVRVGLVDLEGTVVEVCERPLAVPLGELLPGGVCEMIDHLIRNNHIDKERVLGVGLGLPGVVDCEKNTVEYAYAIGMSEKTDCTELLAVFQRTCGLPVYMENDINAAAIGEFTVRGLDKSKDLLYISLGAGLGAGIVLNGKLRHGIHYFAGEIAYTSFDQSFDSQRSAIGWLEKRISAGDTFTRVISGEAPAKEYIESISSTLALTIANSSVLLDFDLVVIGGLLSVRFGKELLGEIEKNLKKMSLLTINCELACSTMPELIGSAFIVFDHRLKDVL